MTDAARDASGSQKIEERLCKLEDSRAISDLLNRYVNDLDSCQWSEWERCFAEDGRAEFPFGSYEGRDGMGAWCAKNLTLFKSFVHLFGGLDIKVEGNRATVRNNAWIACVMDPSRPHEHFDNAGNYRWELVRSSEGWRIKGVQLKIVGLSLKAPKADPYGQPVPAR